MFKEKDKKLAGLEAKVFEYEEQKVRMVTEKEE